MKEETAAEYCYVKRKAGEKSKQNGLGALKTSGENISVIMKNRRAKFYQFPSIIRCRNL